MSLCTNYPGCGESMIGNRSKIRRDLTFLYRDCGVPALVRGNRDLYRITKTRQGQNVFYQWVICNQCKIAVSSGYVEVWFRMSWLWSGLDPWFRRFGRILGERDRERKGNSKFPKNF